MGDEQARPKPLFGFSGHLAIFRNLFSDEQVESMNKQLDDGFASVSSSINDAAATIGDKAVMGFLGAGLLGMAASVALKRKLPHPQHLLMVKPKVDTLNQARQLSEAKPTMSTCFQKKLELEGVSHKAFAFHMVVDAEKASDAFRNKIEVANIHPDIKDFLGKIDLGLAPEQETMDKDFKVSGGEGLYYFYTLRSALAQCPISEQKKVSLACMLCVSKFATLQKLKSVKETTVTDPVYTVKYEPVLKRGGWISSFFRPNEYVIEKKKVYNGTITRTIQTPVFESQSFTAGEIEDLKAYMLKQAADHALSTLNPTRQQLTLVDAAKALE